ncbi:MAG: M56 family metallopeptidase, partial [Bacteroidota bacterium]
MNDIIFFAFQSMAELLGWTILHSLWQIALIAVVLKFLLSWTAQSDATVRYALSVSALLVATFWSAHTFSVEYQQLTFADATVCQERTDRKSNQGTTVDATLFLPATYWKQIEAELARVMGPMTPFLAMLWLLGVLFFTSRLLIGWFRLHHLSTRGIIALPSTWDRRLSDLKRLSGIHQPIVVRLSHLVETPITYRFFRPIVLLPVSLITHLSAEQIEVILLHELAHIRRNDYLINLLQSCVEVLFFYHPLIWWMSKQVRLEREHCCDDRVMNLRNQPMLYAQTLTQIQGRHYSFKTKLAMSATGNTGDFSKRIYRLFEPKKSYASLRNSATVVLLLIFSGAIMAFYPNYSAAPDLSIDPPLVVQDTLPEKGAIKETKLKSKAEVEGQVAALQSELVTLEKALHKNVEALKTEKKKADELDAPKLEELQLKSGELKTAMEVKSQQLKELTSREKMGMDSNQEDPVYLQEEGDLLNLAYLKGRHPIIYLDNKLYDQWEINAEGKLSIGVSASEVHSVKVFKEDKALALFGPEAKDGVVYINTKANPHPDVLIEREKQLHLDSADKKPLLFVDNKISYESIDDLDIDQVKTVNVLKGEAALEKYGEKAKNGVVEVYTKGNEAQIVQGNKTLKGQIEEEKAVPQTNDSAKEPSIVVDGKEPLIVIDGKVKIRQEKGTVNEKLKELNPSEIAGISVLKGERALEAYGDAGENGVVEITTKSNKKALKALEKNKEKKRKIEREKAMKARKKAMKKREKALKAKEKERKRQLKQMKKDSK